MAKFVNVRKPLCSCGKWKLNDSLQTGFVFHVAANMWTYETYGTDLLYLAFIVAWAFKKFCCCSEHVAPVDLIPPPPPPPPPPPLLHSVTAVQGPAFTSWKIIINIFFCPSLFEPFRPSFRPANHLSIRLFACLPACTLLLSHILCVFTCIHRHGDLPV